MPLLSVNVNKVATLRNSRGGETPSVCEAVRVCLAAGAPGITVHPRADQRHITPRDVREIARLLGQSGPGVEFNIEGDPRPDLIDLVLETRPQQCTLVPVQPGELTSQAGWGSTAQVDASLAHAVRRLRDAGVRVSLFIDPQPQAADWAANLGADRIELFTEPFAREFARGAAAGRESFEQYAAVARHAHSRGLGINAGHDLDLDNLPLFATLPHLAEVSIGHALISRALFHGLHSVVREYLAVCAQPRRA
ncbi:MAG: pyridoxine 5'-phosphate synthase [Planctomycetaceae bacterium]